MTEQSKTNLNAQRTRIMFALLNGLYGLSATGTPKVTAYSEGEYLAENGGPTLNFIDQCLGVDEVVLRVKVDGAKKGFTHVIWGNGTGGAISDFSETLEPHLKHALETAEFLDV